MRINNKAINQVLDVISKNQDMENKLLNIKNELEYILNNNLFMIDKKEIERVLNLYFSEVDDGLQDK